MVKTILREKRVEVPKDVTLTMKAKVITVKGVKGDITRSFKSMAVQINEEKKDGKISALTVRVWFAKSKPSSCIRTISSIIRNMIIGVTKGFHYVMKFGFKLHPMQPVAVDGGKAININNFIGKKFTPKIIAQRGVIISTANADTKREIDVEGIDPSAIGITCSQINQKNRPIKKDKRVFRDGLYIFSRNIKQ